MPAPNLPAPVAALAEQLAGLPGAVAVVLGGSRATASHRTDSDWDVGVYYRGSRRRLDPDDLRRLGHEGFVSELGEWGAIMNGGAWLTVAGAAVDVLYRDLDAIERRLDEARAGRFEIVAQNGYLAGAPTYLPVGELALCVPIAGDLPRAVFPDALAATAPERWRARAAVDLMFASEHARLGDGACCAGMLVRAALPAAHARLASRRQWALNEKRLIERAGLAAVQPLLAGASRDLAGAVAAVAELLEVEPLRARSQVTEPNAAG